MTWEDSETRHRRQQLNGMAKLYVRQLAIARCKNAEPRWIRYCEAIVSLYPSFRRAVLNGAAFDLDLLEAVADGRAGPESLTSADFE